MNRPDEQGGSAGGAQNSIPAPVGRVEYDPAIEQMMAPDEAVSFLKLLVGDAGLIHLQTFADGPEDAYTRETFQRRDGSTGTVQKYLVWRWPKGNTGKTVSYSAPTAETLETPLSELPQVLESLKPCNMARCGVFFAVNAIRAGQRRSNDNVTAVRALFLDLDGAPLPDSFPLPPTAIVESSPKRYHVYWATADFPLNRFRMAQKALAERFGGDSAVCDLARVMRLPGMLHGKGEPFTSCVLQARAVTYTFAELAEGLDLASAFEAQDKEEAQRLERAKQQQERAKALRNELNTGELDQEAAQCKYAQAALWEEVAALACAPQGERNHALNRAAFSLGTLAAAGVLEPEEIRAELLPVALAIGLGDNEAQRTLESGLSAGMRHPRDLSGVGQLAGKKRKKRKQGPASRKAARQLARRRAESPAAEAEAEAEVMTYTCPKFPHGVEPGTDEAGALILAHNGAGEKIKYVRGLGWLVYEATRGVWVEDDSGLTLARREAGPILRGAVGYYAYFLAQRGADEDELKQAFGWLMAVGNNHGVINALKAAATHKDFFSELSEWDANPELLNCRNGVLNLVTGELSEHSPKHLMRWQAGANYDPTARHEYVDELVSILQRDGRAEFLQRVGGSCCYGAAPNEIAVLLQGAGGTGKGTMLSSWQATLGDYAGTIDINLLLSNSHGESSTGPKPELLALKGKRLAVAGEPPKGARFNAGRVKGMTGNDPITARGMRSNLMVEFKPVFKLVIHTNYPIKTAHDDDGMKRRLKIVPFNAKPEEPRAAFKSTLENDPTARSAMLNWLVEGFTAWHSSGFDLGESEQIAAATAAHWQEQNPYERFCGDCLAFHPEATLASSELKRLFEEWAEDNGIRMGRGVKASELYETLRAKGAEPARTKAGRFWQGVTHFEGSSENVSKVTVTEVTAMTADPQLNRAYTRRGGVNLGECRHQRHLRHHGWESEEV